MMDRPVTAMTRLSTPKRKNSPAMTPEPAKVRRRLLNTGLIVRAQAGGVVPQTRQTIKPPPRIGAKLKPVTQKAFAHAAPGRAELLLHWRDIVGESLSRHTEPEKLTPGSGLLNNGTLIVRVSGPYALELQHMERQVLERINTYLGYRAAGRLKLVQGPITRHRAPIKAVKAQGSLSGDDKSRIETLAARVHNKDLRTALENLGHSMLVNTNETG